MFCFAVILFNFDCAVKAPFADTRVLNEPKNVRKVFPLFANIRHCSRSSDCLSKQRERVVYANCTISLYQTLCLQYRHRCYHRSRYCCELNSFSSMYHYDDRNIYGFPQSVEFDFSSFASFFIQFF